jgi:hypothetical protein
VSRGGGASSDFARASPAATRGGEKRGRVPGAGQAAEAAGQQEGGKRLRKSAR